MHRPKPHRKTGGGAALLFCAPPERQAFPHIGRRSRVGCIGRDGKASFTAHRAAELREPIAAVLSNPFGGFAFEPVLPCSAYTVTARHRFFTFGEPAQIEPKDFPPDGSGVKITITDARDST